jgi:preprotein translocase subunit YajC
MAGAETTDDEPSSTGWIVGIVILAVLLCGLFAYLMYREHEKKQKRPEENKKEAEQEPPA